MLIELWRFSMVMPMALVLLAAPWLARASVRVNIAVGVLALAEALLLNPGPMVWNVDSAPDEPMAALAQVVQADPGPILPMPERLYQWPLYDQTLHEQPIGSSTEMPADPAIFPVVARKPWSMSELREVARGRGYRWMILHTREDAAGVQPVAQIAADLHDAGLVTWEGRNLLLVDLSAEGAWPEVSYIPIALQLDEAR